MFLLKSVYFLTLYVSFRFNFVINNIGVSKSQLHKLHCVKHINNSFDAWKANQQKYRSVPKQKDVIISKQRKFRSLLQQITIIIMNIAKLQTSTCQNAVNITKFETKLSWTPLFANAK